jgi:hypothetical protein
LTGFVEDALKHIDKMTLGGDVVVVRDHGDPNHTLHGKDVFLDLEFWTTKTLQSDTETYSHFDTSWNATSWRPLSKVPRIRKNEITCLETAISVANRVRGYEAYGLGEERPTSQVVTMRGVANRKRGRGEVCGVPEIESLARDIAGRVLFETQTAWFRFVEVARLATLNEKLTGN